MPKFTFRFLLFALFAFYTTTGILASSVNLEEARIVSGKILDSSTGEPLIGVNVSVEGTSIGVVTDIDGSYSLEVPEETSVLVISYIGYITQRLEVAGRSTIDISLEIDTKTLDEVVVVGYGNQERTKVTGAIGSVDGETLTSLPSFTADQALQGRVPGVMVMNNGSPGADPIVRIRGLGTTGDNSPLIVIDGVITQGLGDLNPNDIETMTVLKDASTTAIFGAQGSNGVVMVTTKQGSKQGTIITADSYIGVQRITQRYDLMNKEQYIQHARNWGVASGRIDDPQYGDLIDNDTKWQDEIFQTGRMQSHNISVAGGGENSTFRIGGGYINQEGVLLNTGTDRFNFRTNSSFTKGKLRIGQTLSASLVTRKAENTAGGRSAIEHAIKMAPYFAVYNENNIGGYQGVDNSLDAQDAENPVRVLAHPQNVSDRTNLLGSAFAEYEIIEGLTLRGQAGLDYWQFNSNSFTAAFSGEPTAVAFAQIGKGTGTHKQITSYTSLNYLKSFGNHNFDAILVGEKINSEDTRLGASSTNSITNEIVNLTNDDLQGGSFRYDYARIGYLGRLNYDYSGKYILAGSYRRDGGSRFGSDNRWGDFYSLAGGWVISKEDFFNADGIVSYLKLRASTGTVGNDKIGNYLYNSSIRTGSYNTSFVDAITGETYLGLGTTAGNLANPSLRWEETQMTNVGFDMYLFDNQFSLSGEYYRNVSDGLLINIPAISSLGGDNGSFPSNVGSVTVSGYEVDLGYKDYTGAFTWSADINLGTTDNLVNDLAGQVLVGGNFENANLLRSVEGESLNHFYGYVTDGLFQTEEEILTSPLQEGAMPGDIKFRDISGEDGVPDGVIDDLDKIIIGNPIPDLTLGLSGNMAYKNFDFAFFINGMYGNEIYNTNIWDLEGGRRFFNASPAALDAWTPTNRDTDIPRITTDPQNLLPSDRFIEDGSFTRLKNVSLGYTINNIVRGKSSIRIYLSGQNLYTLTNYSGLDPEVGSSALVGNTSSQLGIDRGNYPLPKSFIGGIQIKF